MELALREGGSLSASWPDTRRLWAAGGHGSEGGRALSLLGNVDLPTALQPAAAGGGSLVVLDSQARERRFSCASTRRPPTGPTASAASHNSLLDPSHLSPAPDPEWRLFGKLCLPLDSGPRAPQPTGTS